MSVSALEWAGVIAGSGAVGSVITKLFDWKRAEAEEEKLDADAAQAITQAAIGLIAPLQAQVTDLLERVTILETENHMTKTKLQKAIDHIRELRRWVHTHLPDRTPPAAPVDLMI